MNHVPTQVVSAGDLLFVAGENGTVKAFHAKDGSVAWTFASGSPIKYPPTISKGRAYFGNGLGYVYCLEAKTGRELWRFRAAPIERHMMVYGHLCSTWPVNTGVLVDKDVAYFAAGIIDSDGTYIYALNAMNGKIKWQNNSSGHLNEILRKGVSAQGNLSIQGGQLILAGGNQVSPARYDLKTGKCLNQRFDQGHPKSNAGRFVGVFNGQHVIQGGRILYSAPRNVATKGSFAITHKSRTYTLAFGGIPPAWHDKTFAMVNFRHGKLTCCDADKVSARVQKGYSRNGRNRFRNNIASLLEEDKAIRWQSDLGESRSFEALSTVVCSNAVVAVVRYQHRVRSQPSWYLIAFDLKSGRVMARQELKAEPLPGGLMVTREGKSIISTIDGQILCFGKGEPRRGADRPR